MTLDLAEPPPAVDHEVGPSREFMLDEMRRLKTRLFRVEPPIMHRGRIALGGLWPGQRAWWDLSNEVRVFAGGYGSGKSTVLRKAIIAISLANSPAPSSYTAPTYAMGRELIALPMAEDMERIAKVRAALGQRFTWEWRKSIPMEFRFTHEFEARRLDGSMRRVIRTARITINSGDDPNKLKGTNIGAFAMEEPFMQERAVFEQLMRRKRHGAARVSAALLAGTPEGLGWGYDLAEGELTRKYDVGLVYSSTFENLANPSNYAPDMLRALDAKAASSYVYGRFENLSTGLVYWGFDRNENVVPLSMPEGAQIGLGIDFNVNPMAAVVFWYTREPEPHIHYFDEIELPNSDTATMADIVNATYGTPGTKTPICVRQSGGVGYYSTTRGIRDVWPDPAGKQRRTSASGRTDFKILEDAGFTVHAHSQAPAVRDRENTVNGMLRPANGKVRMTFAPWCSRLVKYQMAYTHERRNTTEQKALSHLLDARDYPAEHLFPMNRETARLMRILGV